MFLFLLFIAKLINFVFQTFPLFIPEISAGFTSYIVQIVPIHQGARPVQTSNIPYTKSHIHILSLGSFVQRIRPGPRLFRSFHNKFIFYGEGL
jgi:hypothetical protein